jgi:UDP-glucose 4-epimerase
MRILVTGGAGFIGSHVAEAYLAAGHEVHIIDNLSTGRRANVPVDAVLHEVDIHSLETERIFASLRPSVVNHLAAQASVKVSTRVPVSDLESNVGGTARIAQLCVQFGVGKLIYASSGGTVYGDPQQLPVSEDHTCIPTSPYGLSKYAGELYVQLFHRMHGLDYTIFRYGNAFGPRQDPNGEAGVVAIFAERLLEGRQPVINGHGEQTRDYVFVGDVVRAMLAGFDHEGSGTFNVGTGRETSVNELFRTLNEITGGHAEEVHAEGKPGEQQRSVLDVSRARRTLGWEPEVELAEGLRQTVAWFRERTSEGVRG